MRRCIKVLVVLMGWVSLIITMMIVMFPLAVYFTGDMMYHITFAFGIALFFELLVIFLPVFYALNFIIMILFTATVEVFDREH